MRPVRPELRRFVEATFPRAEIRIMAGDASSRRFYRITLPGGATRVLMDYGSPFEGQTDDLRLARVFGEAGLPVARVLKSAPDPGCLVLEDLGARTLEHALRDEGPEGRERWFRAAVELAVRVAVDGTPALAGSERATGPALDRARLRFEMEFFLEHFVQGLRRRPDPPHRLREALYELAASAADTPARVLCHRDYHSRNLVARADGTLAMVDIQDARWGPDTYDLASLLRDAYVDLDEELVERMVELYRTSLPHPPEAKGFRRRFDVVSAQRMIKALGTFGCQIASYGRERYRDAIPRTRDRLRRLLPTLDLPPDLLSLIV